MGFRAPDSDSRMGRSRSYSHIQEGLVPADVPPFNPPRTATSKRASWTAPPASRQKVDSLPISVSGYEKDHEGGPNLPGKKGGGLSWLHGWRRLVGRAMVVLILTVFMVATLVPYQPFQVRNRCCSCTRYKSYAVPK
jgi:hypothetical protein